VTAGSRAGTAHRLDSAVVASLALQHGADLETLRGALLRDSSGEASGPLGCALDLSLSLGACTHKIGTVG
jgi:hypothetical protein